MRGGVVPVLAAVALSLAAGGATGQTRRWTVITERSSIAMSVTAFGAREVGHFDDWSGDIRFDPVSPEAARVEIDVRSASLRMTHGAATRRAIGPAFLDAGRYPSIRFRLTRLDRIGPDRFTARADVTVKGRSRPVVFPVDLRVDGGTAQMTGGFSLDRDAFDIGTRGPWNAVIGRQVRVDVSLATRAG